MIRKSAFAKLLSEKIKRRFQRMPEKKEELKIERKTEGLKFKEQVTFEVRILNAKSKKPVEGAEVSLNNKSEKSRSNGKVTFLNISKGKHEMVVKKEIYETKKSTYSVEKEESLDILLTPASKISDAQLKRLNSLRALLDRNLQNISSPDLCLPRYYASIGNKMADFVEGVFATPEYLNSSNYEEATEKLIEVAQEVCKNLSELMLDWKNIRLYKTSKLKGECAAKDFTDEGMLEKILEDPKKFADTKLPTVEERLATLDSLITEKIKELTILPVSGLLSMSKKLLKNSIENELKRAVYIMFADIMLNYVEEMLENQDIVSRLKYTIF